MLKAAHPGLYWHSSPQQFDSAVGQIQRDIDTPLPETEFLQKVVKLNQVIKCVHSFSRPSIDFVTWWNDSARILPINIVKLDNKYFVSKNSIFHNELSFGTEILSINGRSIHRIVEQILPNIPSDGMNVTRKHHSLTRSFTRYYSWFIEPTTTHYEIEYVGINASVVQTQVAGVSRDQFMASIKEQNAPQSPVSFSIDKELSTAVLTVQSFRHDLMEDHNLVFHDFMTNSFRGLHEQHIEYLIVDLRDNGGGYSEYGAQLNAFLADSAFQYCRDMVLTTEKTINGIDYDIPETFDDFPMGIVQEDGVYKWKKHSILGWRKKEKYAFKGKVYFLINGGCVSTTSEFASVAHHLGQGTFIGEEVGGSYLGDSGGVLGWVTLPNTGIRFRMAMVKYELAVDNRFSGHGVIPQYQVTPTIVDLRNHKDVAMDFAQDLIHADKFTKN